MNALLSIITVTKNDLPGLMATYESLVSQDCSLDCLEWIVIDAESSDGSVEFLKGLHPGFDFTYISEGDSGIFDAMNKGVDKAMGQYLLFLNAGDLLFNESVLTNVLPYLHKNSLKIVAGKVALKWEDVCVLGVDVFPWVPHQAAFIHRSCFGNRYYDDNLKFYGDLKFWMTLKDGGLFRVQRIELNISQFFMGGAGNNPTNIFERLKERNRLSIEFKESVLKVIARTGFFIFLYFSWKLFGSRFYYKLVMKA